MLWKPLQGLLQDAEALLRGEGGRRKALHERLHQVHRLTPVRRIDHHRHQAVGPQHGTQRAQPFDRRREVMEHARADDQVELTQPKAGCILDRSRDVPDAVEAPRL